MGPTRPAAKVPNFNISPKSKLFGSAVDVVALQQLSYKLDYIH